MTEKEWMMRIIFLETIAGVPGMVGGMIRHLRSIRKLEKEGRWIETLLEEAENERMHLMTFMAIKKPGLWTRSMIVAAQGIFCNTFFFAYLMYVYPRKNLCLIVGPLVHVIDSWGILRKKPSLHILVVLPIIELVYFQNGRLRISKSQILQRITGIFHRIVQWRIYYLQFERMKPDIDMSITPSLVWKIEIRILLLLRRWKGMGGIKPMLVGWVGIAMI
jgi:Alternative oxidase